jgi:hypothetical protein
VFCVIANFTITRDRARLETFSVVVIVIVRDWELFLSS